MHSFRIVLFSAALLTAPFLSAACAVRMDDARTLTRHNANAEENAAAGKGRFPLRFDSRTHPDKARRAVSLAGDPRLRPTVQELRERRGAAMQEQELLLSGGMPQYRGDGSSSSINSLRFAASPGALTLDYAAAPDLNALDGAPHALTLVVYHLSDRAAFDQLARHEHGIRKLLEADYFDSSVKGVRAHTVQPGTRGRLVEDRRDDGRYIALVAGYNTLRPQTAVYVTEYRVYEWQTNGATRMSRKKSMFSPLPLRLAAVLDAGGMRVADTDTLPDRMHRVTRIERRQLAGQLTPAPHFNADAFISSGGSE